MTSTPRLPETGVANTITIEPGNGTRYFIVYGADFVALPDFGVAATCTPHPNEHTYLASKLKLNDVDARVVFEALNPGR
jgi:hypothetical protein